MRHVEGLLAKNFSTRQRLSFLGAGTYHHYVPAVVDEVIGRSEFLTAYAGEPYEDHGRFQALFQYQSLMAELLAMDVVNVPTYDGYQATATALSMAGRMSGRRRILVASDVLPAKLSKVRDFVRVHLDLEFIADGRRRRGCRGARRRDWRRRRRRLGGDPERTGAVETQLRQIADSAHAVGAVLVVGTDPDRLRRADAARRARRRHRVRRYPVARAAPVVRRGPRRLHRRSRRAEVHHGDAVAAVRPRNDRRAR